MEKLKTEYVLTHNPVLKGIASGTEDPPAEWLNKRLEELGEKRRVTDAPAPLQSQVLIPSPAIPASSSTSTRNITSGHHEQDVGKTFVPVDSDRAFLGVAHAILHTELMDSTATLTVQNPTNYTVLENAQVRGAIIPSLHLPDSEQENKLFAAGPEWQTGGAIIPEELPPGATHRVKIGSRYPIDPDEWEKVEKGEEVVYLVTEIYARDRLGVLPAFQTCWYVQAPNWNQFHSCFGHNGIGGGGDITKPPS